jgi:probable F420-dependent oxidoreductase
MKFGIAIFPTDYAIPMTELAPAVEERGFESLWVAEHTHIPASRQTPWPGGAELPKDYWHALDPFVALTAAATVTSTLRVATGVCLVVEHDPIVTAKEVASVDFLSGGRFLFGVGGGWNREEMANHGTRYETRWKLLRERVEAMKAIWTQEEAEYRGEFVNFDPIWSWPKPVQKPHPPVLLGGNGPRTPERVVRYADGWMPNRGDYLSRIPELQRMAEEAGRAPIPVSTYPRAAGGREEIERMAAAGIERCIYYLPADGRDPALRRLEELTELTEPYRG